MTAFYFCIMTHIKIDIAAGEYQQEELIALLDEYHATGFEQNDESLIAYFREDDFKTDEVLTILDGYQYQLSKIEETNWNAAWEQSFQPVIVSDFCAIRAHFHQPISTAQYDIVITPKMSFGTGHHATTFMMIEQMREIDFENKKVFDFGTGTGILAILSQKLGAASVTAIDIDEWSIENAIENRQQNAADKVVIELSSIIPLTTFDIILANINRNVLLDYMKDLSLALNSGGQLLISGLLADDENAITNACNSYSLALQKRLEKSGWISLLFTNSK